MTYGAGVHWVLEILKDLPHFEVDLLDLRTLQPLDKESIFTSVKKTGKVLILTEDTIFGSLASDIASLITENCFEFLDAPVMRVGSLETPVPFAGQLENLFLPKVRLLEKLKQLLDY